MKKLLLCLLLCATSTFTFAQLKIDKQLQMTGNAPDNQIKNVGDPTAVGDAVNAGNIQKGALIYANDAGSANAYSVTLSPPITAYTTGMVVNFIAANGNTGASTINVNGLGAKAIKKYVQQDLAGCDILSGQIVSVVYDGTNFQITTLTLPFSTSVTIAANPSGAVCSGTTVTFTATPTNGGSAPIYQWKVNGLNVGTNNHVYSYAPANGDVITCVLTSSLGCAAGSPATSNSITETTTILPTANISYSGTPYCSNAGAVSVTFSGTSGGTYSASPAGLSINSGTGTIAPGSSTPGTYTVSYTIPASGGCPQITASSPIAINAVVAANVSISANPSGAICLGTSVTFTASPTNGGTSPSYQWKLNGGNVGSNSPFYSNNTLANGDNITCVMTSNATCVTGSPATSNAIAMTTNNSPAVTMTTYGGTGTNPWSIAFDGANMWTANWGDNSVTKITPAGVLTTYSGTGAGPQGIAFDGTNMWTANYTGNSVTKITPSGAMTTYTGTGSGPAYLAFDGTNMWTANAIGNSVTKITPAGTMTTYTGTGSGAVGIAFDGTNMWTANFYSNSVSKITSAGTITTYSGTGANPYNIAFDGTNMWTANYGGSSVTKITPSGTMTTYTGAGGGSTGIAFDGTNMWTANQSSNSVTKISPAGTMTTYTGTGATPRNIAFDGTNMWTSNQGNSVTKIIFTDAVSVTISASPSQSIYSGANVIFTATPVNGGTAPSYQWKINGNNVGSNSATYSSSTLANGDIITCVMTSNATCVTGSPAISNSVTMTVNNQITFNTTGTGQNGSIQTFTIPAGVTSLTIDAYGAQGGFNGGLGARVKGTYIVNPGDILKVLVGQKGLLGGGGNHGSGGGGSFIWVNSTNTLLVAAAGGGGSCYNGVGGAGSGTTTTTSGTGSGSGTGGTSGNGGSGGSGSSFNYGTGGGGAGWSGNGGNGTGGTDRGGGGFTPLNGGTGGSAGGQGGVAGGFGGGGGSAQSYGAGGGGGGYNGGGGGNDWNGSAWGPGGGGGSYNNGTNTTNMSGVQSGDGQVIISW